MINQNEIAFTDNDGFEFNDGESLIRFDAVAYYPDEKKITFAVTDRGHITVGDYEIFESKRGKFIEYGYAYRRIYIDEFMEERQ